MAAVAQREDRALLPRVGMLAKLRNRRGLVVAVDPFDASPEGRFHLVRVEYTESDGVAEDTVIWEREHGCELLEPHALPRVEAEPPMPAADFEALVRAARWSALTPFLNPDDSGQRAALPITAPFFGAVQVDDFQLVPLLRALQMPRISLLLADDVGLGKTIEAGLVLTELLLRRRIRRVLVLCPASLRTQWAQEMKEKFSLSFDLIDRPETHALQKRLGLDANPWRTFSRIIASYYYLRQPDVLEQFLATCRRPEQPGEISAQLPWDLLIVDEAHNLMPANFGEDSDLAKMLRAISPFFEHKLFLTATPHNGHTRCFSGLLEQLDPVRFTRTAEFTQDEKQRVEEVVVRRLKREINELDDRLGRPRRFAERYLEAIPLFLSREEQGLAAAVAQFRKAVKALISSAGRADQRAGAFAIEVLSKRLLSCPYTFAESWFRFEQGLQAEECAAAAEVWAAQRASEEELDDDQERDERARHAARTIGAWLQPFVGQLQEEIARIDACLERLGLHPEGEAPSYPREDTRFERLVKLIQERLRSGKAWVTDERLIVFTEYKTTLDYLHRRLPERFADQGQAIRVLYGGMDLQEREEIKRAFNDPQDPVRVLVATDAASEGLNLQETARLILHYEIPWNPARLEQRNGRLDRHGQGRDVFVYHFTSEDDADLRFIAHVVEKVHEIREDLGSMGEVFDAAFERRFQDLEDTDQVIQSLDRQVKASQGQAVVPRPAVAIAGTEEAEKLGQWCQEIDLSPATLRQTLEVALGIGFGQPRLEGPDARGYMKLRLPLPPRWEGLIDDTLRLEGRGASKGALPGLVFDPQQFIRQVGNRPVFRPARDAVLLHLGHPLFRHALAALARARFPGGDQGFAASRWTVRQGRVPPGAEALILLTVEELAVNELREPFHHWVRTLRIPVRNLALEAPLPFLSPSLDRAGTAPSDPRLLQRAQELWSEVAFDLSRLLQQRAEALTARVTQHLKEAGKRAQEEEKKRFQQRLREVEQAMRETSLQKLEREREKLLARMQQAALFADWVRRQEERLRDLEEELRRRRSHYQELLDQLREEQARVLERMLPRRYALRGQVQVFPVAVEILFPQEQG